MIKSIISKLKNAGDNDKIVYKNVLGAFLVKGGALFVALYTLPAYIKFFNNDEVLGLWYTILSLLNWILNFDLGIGNGLRNYLSSSLSLGNRGEVKKYISSAYFSIGAIVLLLSVAFPFAVHNVNLNSVFSISPDDVTPKALYISAIIVFIGVMLQFWLKLINSVLYALQKSSVNNFLVLCTNVIILLFAMFYPSGSNSENIIIMAVVHAVAVALPLLVASGFVFLGNLRYAFPRLKYVSKPYIKKVLCLGGMFFFVQIAYMVIMSTNEFLITRTAGNSYNVDYQAYYKLFSLGSTVFALALTPIWSVITKAMAEGNYRWIRSTYKKFMAIAFLFCLGEFFIVAIMSPLMKIWLGKSGMPHISYPTGLLFALLGCAMIINSVLSSVANGIGELKTQALCFGIGAALKIPLSYLLVNLIGSWNGVVIANIICMGIYCIIQPTVLNKYFGKHIHSHLKTGGK